MNNKNHTKKDLPSRHESEADFRDRKYGHGEGCARHYAVHPTYPIYRRMLGITGGRSGDQVLDCVCGDGWITGDLARDGAGVSAFDVSAEAVRKTRQVLVSAGLSEQCRVAQMGAERLDYPDSSFVIAIGFAILHHLELETALTEFRRVRKPGGVAFVAGPRNTFPDQSLPPADAAAPHRG